jgi:pantoate--beta-alanine ligase
MERLLGIIQPNRLFLGQKDFQQCMVISKLNEQLPNRAIIEIVPTVREKSGLAMSSRNKRLSEEGLKNAAAIYQSLNFLKNKLAPGKLTDLLETAGKMLTDAGFEKIDYLVIADRASLSVLTHWDGKTPVTAICAAFLGGVRLIDNLALN